MESGDLSAMKRFIIAALALEDVRAEDIADDEPLFQDGLGLDSIDAVELAVAIERELGIQERDPELLMKAFASVSELTRFVSERGCSIRDAVPEEAG